MRLKQFRVTNFRNIHDSGWVELEKTTALVGRNESGKTNLLAALAALVGPGDASVFTRGRDFPADRMRGEYKDDLPVIRTEWVLSEEEKSELSSLSPETGNTGLVEVSRCYTGPPIVHLENSTAAASEWVIDRLPGFVFVDDVPEIDGKMNLRDYARRQAEGSLEAADTPFGLLLNMAGIDDAALAELLDGDLETRRQIVGQAGALVTRRIRAVWTDRPLKVRFYLDGDQLHTLVCEPTEFSDLEVNLNQRSRGFRWFFSFCVIVNGSQEQASDRGIFLLLDEPGLHLHPTSQIDLIRHLSGIEAPTLLATQARSLLPSGPETSVVSIRYELETGARAHHGSIDLGPETSASEDVAPAAQAEEAVLISEPEPVEVFAEEEPAEELAQEDVSDDSPADEPEAADSEEPNTIYVAHNETVTLDEVGTTILAGLIGDGPTLLVEHMSDLWYLRAASEYLIAQGRTGLPSDVYTVPVGKAAYLGLVAGASRATGNESIVVLGTRPTPELVAVLGDQAEILENGYVYFGQALEEERDDHCDLEDLIDTRVYERFVSVMYGKELPEADFEFDASEPRMLKRCEAAVEPFEVPFSRARPAKLVASGSERNVRTFLSGDTADHFEKLFELITEKFESISSEPSIDFVYESDMDSEESDDSPAEASELVDSEAEVTVSDLAVEEAAEEAEELGAETVLPETSFAESDETTADDVPDSDQGEAQDQDDDFCL